MHCDAAAVFNLAVVHLGSCLDPRANHPFNLSHVLPGIKHEFIRVSLWRKGLNKKRSERLPAQMINVLFYKIII